MAFTASPKLEEKRQQPKRALLVASARVWEGESPDGPGGRNVWLNNVSIGGVAFRAMEPLTVGGIYYLRLVAGPLKLDTPIRVVWCRRRDDGAIHVGAAFVSSHDDAA